MKIPDELDAITVLKVVPTGTAAFKLSILPLRYIKTSDNPLGENKANTLKKNICKLQLLIIYEISKVSQDLLLMIRKRLHQVMQIKSSCSWFGDVIILLLVIFIRFPHHGKCFV